ncbi:MAG: hypothetical protein AVDCRST_MAG31-2004, partial [uncultured Sphingomonas sp.]
GFLHPAGGSRRGGLGRQTGLRAGWGLLCPKAGRRIAV